MVLWRRCDKQDSLTTRVLPSSGLALVTVAWLLVAVLTTLFNVASSQRFFLTPFVLAWAELALLAATVYARSRVGWRRKLFPGLGEYLVVAGWAALFTVVGLR